MPHPAFHRAALLGALVCGCGSNPEPRTRTFDPQSVRTVAFGVGLAAQSMELDGDGVRIALRLCNRLRRDVRVDWASSLLLAPPLAAQARPASGFAELPPSACVDKTLDFHVVPAGRAPLTVLVALGEPNSRVLLPLPLPLEALRSEARLGPDAGLPHPRQ